MLAGPLPLPDEDILRAFAQAICGSKSLRGREGRLRRAAQMFADVIPKRERGRPNGIPDPQTVSIWALGVVGNWWRHIRSGADEARLQAVTWSEYLRQHDPLFANGEVLRLATLMRTAEHETEDRGLGLWAAVVLLRRAAPGELCPARSDFQALIRAARAARRRFRHTRPLDALAVERPELADELWLTQRLRGIAPPGVLDKREQRWWWRAWAEERKRRCAGRRTRLPILGRYVTEEETPVDTLRAERLALTLGHAAEPLGTLAVPVRFLRTWDLYNPGEVAAFGADQAWALVKHGIAEPYQR